MEGKHTLRTEPQSQELVHLIPETSLNPNVRHHRPVAKALSESRSGEINKKIKSGLESVYPGIKNYAYPLKLLVQFWALKAAPDGRRYLATTSDRIFRLSNYDERLFRYWAHCRSRDHFVDGGPEAEDAFCQSAPAWTQEAWQRSTKDHPELNHALHFALPVVEPSSTSAQHSQSHSVVGLLEIVVMPNYNNSGYAEAEGEVTKIREALEGKNVLVIGTTSEVAFLDSVGICAAFSYTYRVPTLKTEDAKKVLHQLNVFSEDDIDAAADALNDMPIKKLYMVVETAAQGEQGGGAEAIYSGK